MNELIQKIANTLVSNLANTSEIGLFKGKMGIALFMYEYAKKFYPGNIYEQIADSFIDDIYDQIKPDTPSSIIDGSAGIGYGLSYLLKKRFIDGNPDTVLEDLDKRLLQNPKEVLLKEMTSPLPVFSSGLYLLSRSSFCKEEQLNRWTTLLSDAAIYFVISIVKRQHFEPKLSLLNSMLFIFNKLSKDYTKNKDNNILDLQHDLLILIISTIKKGSFVDIDIRLLKEIKKMLPAELYQEYERYLDPLLSSLDITSFEMEELNNELWWYFIYGIEILSSQPKENIEKYVNQKLLDYSYNIENINSQFSILGLSLLNNNINFKKFEL